MKKGISQNISMMVLTVIFVHVMLTDCMIYFGAIGYIMANVIAAIGELFLLIFLLQKKIVRITNEYDRWDLIFWIILAATCVLTIGFADESFDTYNYHIYLQENPFTDKIHEDFFPGRTLNSFIYPLADRVFYLFRGTFGYRLGTLPSYLVLIPMFYGVKRLLRLLASEMERKFLSVLSMVPLCTFIILQQTGTYYIDNFSIVFILEFTYAAMADEQTLFENRAQMYFLALLAGITTCIKVTNAVFLIGLIVYIFMKNYKNLRALKWFDYIFAVGLFLVPLLPYGLDAVRQTGSPVFPYYNRVFRSAYFTENNWFDLRWGPVQIWQFLIWPVYILFHPEQAYEYQIGLTNIAFAAGYILSLIYFVKGLYAHMRKTENSDKRKWCLSCILLYDCLVWGKFMIGYIRYGGIIPVLGMIFVIWLLWEGVVNKNWFRKAVYVTLLSVSVLAGGVQYCRHCVPKWYAFYIIPARTQSGQAKKTEFASKIRRAFTMLGKDKDKWSYDIDGIWGAVGNDSLSPQILSVDDRIVFLEYGVATGETEKAQQIYWDNVRNNDIYVPLFGNKAEEKLEMLDTYHFKVFEITDMFCEVPFAQEEQTMYIIRVQYNQEHSNGNAEIFEKLKNMEEQDEIQSRSIRGERHFGEHCELYSGADLSGGSGDYDQS